MDSCLIILLSYIQIILFVCIAALAGQSRPLPEGPAATRGAAGNTGQEDGSHVIFSSIKGHCHQIFNPFHSIKSSAFAPYFKLGKGFAKFFFTFYFLLRYSQNFSCFDGLGTAVVIIFYQC